MEQLFIVFYVCQDLLRIVHECTKFHIGSIHKFLVCGMLKKCLHSIVIAIDIVKDDRTVQPVQTFECQDLKKLFISSNPAWCYDRCV